MTDGSKTHVTAKSFATGFFRRIRLTMSPAIAGAAQIPEATGDTHLEHAGGLMAEWVT